jgi:hypothetical protein
MKASARSESVISSLPRNTVEYFFFTSSKSGRMRFLIAFCPAASNCSSISWPFFSKRPAQKRRASFGCRSSCILAKMR